MNTNPLTEPHTPLEGEPLNLEDPRLVAITRIRLLSDPDTPFWDVSYVHGLNDQGQRVRVLVDWFQIPKNAKRTTRANEGFLVAWLLKIEDVRRKCFVREVLSLCQ